MYRSLNKFCKEIETNQIMLPTPATVQPCAVCKLLYLSNWMLDFDETN
jgi:hypothetical protein